MKLALALTTTAALSIAAAHAQEKSYYIAGSLGGSFLNDSDNSGDFTEDFTVTGTGTALDGAVLPSGTDVGWTTEFDDSLTYSVAVGKKKGPYRAELELAYAQSDVDTHSGVEAGGTDLDAVDAAVLIEGQTDPLGATVGTIVADGQGDISTTYLFANAYMDFEYENAALTPYIGGGIGAGFVEVDYSPSGVGIVDDEDTVFAYQVMAGASYAVAEQTAVFGEIGYRGTTDVEVETDLFPGELEIENRGVTAEIGLRYTF